MENLDIFNLGIDDFKTEEKQTRGSDIYKCDPKQSKDSIYRAILRFIPNLENPKRSIAKKFSYWLEDEAGAGFYADCPSSNPGEKSVIQDTFWRLFKSESAFDKKQSERIKRKEYYYMYVYVVKDPQRPEIENTVQIARFPKAIKKLIDSQLEPSAEDIEMGIEPTNIFDFFAGKDFSMKVTLKGGYWNYDESKFSSAVTPISLNGVKMDNNEESRKMILSIYEGLTPLSDHEFKPWNEELQTRVYQFLSTLTGNPGTSYAAVTAPNTSKPTTNLMAESIPSIENVATEATKSNDDGIEDWLKEFDVK